MTPNTVIEIPSWDNLSLEPLVLQCGRCGCENVTWGQHGGEWRLWVRGEPGVPHVCQAEDEGEELW